MSHRHSWRASLFDSRYEMCGSCPSLRRAEVLLNPVQAREERDAAVRKVEEWSDAEWMRQATKMGQQIAREMREFTSDEFWRRGLPKPREPRALGPVMTALMRDGLIESTDRLVNTSQVLRHAAPVRVWRSRMHSEVA